MARTEPSARFVPLGIQLRSRREAAGLTQVEVARALGWSHSAVTDIEAGRRRLNIFEFVDYVIALGCDPMRTFDELVAGAYQKGAKR
ncbi:helix-turn-helix domain-containing protein [Sphingomonas caseinilyticus]|uniref:helix-turn-helix domain-containing protein n=1 Tax=Sphingomonas caseinilyticus TaxID=2908205 RepID=UPI00344EE0B6